MKPPAYTYFNMVALFFHFKSTVYNRSPTLTYLHLDFDGYNSKNMHRFKIWESLSALGLETLKVFEVRFPPFHDYENSENVLKVSDGPGSQLHTIWTRTFFIFCQNCAIFDDFFCTLNFEKSSKMAKILGGNEEKSCLTSGQPINYS